MQGVFLSVLPIFLITVLGSLIKSRWLTADEFWKGLEKLSYFLLFPVMLFNYIATAELQAQDLTKLNFALIIATSLTSITLILYKRFAKVENALFSSVFQGGVRYNNYIFFALSDALYGSEGLRIAAVVAAYMIIFTNVISVFIFNTYPAQEDALLSASPWKLLIRRICTNPMIIASFSGALFNSLGPSLNIGISNTFDILSQSALAVGIINVGAGLRFAFNIQNVKAIVVSVASKLLILPLFTFLIFKLFTLSETSKYIGLVYSGLPSATTAYVLSKQLGGDHETMATIITLTTLLSVFSLSLIIYSLN